MSNFLIKYRSTPHRITGRTPAELFLGQPIRTRFSLLKPSLQDTVEANKLIRNGITTPGVPGMGECGYKEPRKRTGEMENGSGSGSKRTTDIRSQGSRDQIVAYLFTPTTTWCPHKYDRRRLHTKPLNSWICVRNQRHRRKRQGKHYRQPQMHF